jgi:NADPH-dependent 2,4-dienoyl-CoA reductase/sulfur reductase-like enzyme
VDADVLIVGAGPAGLAAAAELRRLGGPRVLVADREGQPGGIPRHSFHPGYGLRDLRRPMSGPAYARALADAAGRAGAELRTGCTVTELRVGGDALSAVLTSAAGIEEVCPAAVLLATGCRERPRPARLVPGDRPSGVLTTGELQQRVYLGGERLGGRALVVGAEHVSFSAMVTLAHAGARVVALVTEHERQQSYAAFRVGAALRWGVPVWTSTAVTRVTGAGGRLASVDVAGLAGGQPRTVACDWLVFTGDWIPDHVLARSSGLALDTGTRGPLIDTRLATSAPGVFAAGNLVHAAETADVAALSGRHAARQIDSFLAGRASPSAGGIPVVAESPLRWISPNVIAAGPVPPPLGRFTLRAAEFRPRARLETRQDGRLLARSRPLRLIPGRPVYLRASWLAQVDPGGGPVGVGLEPARLCALVGWRVREVRRPRPGQRQLDEASGRRREVASAVHEFDGLRDGRRDRPDGGSRRRRVPGDVAAQEGGAHPLRDESDDAGSLDLHTEPWSQPEISKGVLDQGSDHVRGSGQDERLVSKILEPDDSTGGWAPSGRDEGDDVLCSQRMTHEIARVVGLLADPNLGRPAPHRVYDLL